jgi:polyphosphate glucokinase
MTGPSPESSNRGFGIDVGGSGVKGGIVDLDTGQLIGERFKLPTPQPSTPTRSPRRSPRSSSISTGPARWA